MFILAKLTMQSIIREDNNKKEMTMGMSKSHSRNVVHLSPRSVLRTIVN